MFGDMTVFLADPLTIDADDLLSVSVDVPIVGGELVFAR